MNKKTGLSILSAITGVVLSLITRNLYYWLGKLLPRTLFPFYYTGHYTVFIPFLVGVICFILLVLAERIIQKIFRIEILNLSFYLILMISIMVCSWGIGLYEATRDEFGGAVFYIICDIWITAGMLRSFKRLYSNIKNSPHNKWNEYRSFYFAIVLTIINIILAILCS